MMKNYFTQARNNMVTHQLVPGQVGHPALLDAFGAVAREHFVPVRYASVAYLDDDIAVGPGRHLMAPWVLARLIQAAEPHAGDKALNIACASGYTAALLAHMGIDVVALESIGHMSEETKTNLDAIGLDSINVVQGVLAAGWPDQGAYDMVIIEGGIDQGQDLGAIYDHMTDGGRLVAVNFDKPPAFVGEMGRAFLDKKIGKTISRRWLFDAGVPYLKDFSHHG